MAVTCASLLPAQTPADGQLSTWLWHPPRRPAQTTRIGAGHRPANRGRVRDRVTPQGVWKLAPVARQARLVKVASETESRHKAYGNLVRLMATSAATRPKQSHATRRMETS